MLRSLLIASFLMLLATGRGNAQTGGSNPASHPPVPPSWPLKIGENPPTSDSTAPMNPAERMRAEAMTKANAKRQQQASADADKLLQLATQLKEEISQTNANTLSIQTIKKAQEIEKLAKSVKNNLMPVSQ
jgi:hypothetical protein